MANILSIISNAISSVASVFSPSKASSGTKVTGNTGALANVTSTVAASKSTSTNIFASTLTPIATTTKPLQVAPSTNLGDLKTESTTVTYGQQYQIQVLNSDGVIKLVTIPASELVSQSVSVNALSASGDLQNSEATLLRGVYLTANEANSALQAGLRIDLNMALQSQESNSLEYNTLQTPSLKSNLIYNFYQENEANIAVQEDPSKDPFSQNISSDKVPLYVSLQWDPTDTIVESPDFSAKTVSEENIIQQYLKPVRGVANGTNADQNKVNALLKQTNTLSKDGLKLELVDTHDLPLAFNSISNGRIFKNSALTVVNTVATNVDKVDFNDILYDELI